MSCTSPPSCYTPRWRRVATKEIDHVKEPIGPCLGDIGERQIVEEILRPRYGSSASPFGDDCASLAVGAGTLLITTDPCPEPAISRLGLLEPGDRGWMLATINLSDLAAAGARPLGLSTSLELPSSTTVADFVALLDGLDACCRENGTTVLGGNLKESAAMVLTATAIGYCPAGEAPMRRVGAAAGDLLCVVGPLGDYWATTLLLRAGHDLPDVWRDEAVRQLRRPRPQVAAGSALRSRGAVSCAMDNSDGLYGSAAALASANGLGVVLDLAGVEWSAVTALAQGVLGVDPVRLALGWGDWQLVVGVSPDRLTDARAAVDTVGARLHVVGEFQGNPAGVHMRLDGRTRPMVPMDSERFRGDSIFTSGVEIYERMLLDSPLVQDER
jgi:thiamine-monophosphate kinase